MTPDTLIKVLKALIEQDKNSIPIYSKGNPSVKLNMVSWYEGRIAAYVHVLNMLESKD